MVCGVSILVSPIPGASPAFATRVYLSQHLQCNSSIQSQIFNQKPPKKICRSLEFTLSLSICQYRLNARQCRLNACQCRLNVRQCRLNARQCRLNARQCRLNFLQCRLNTRQCRLNVRQCRLNARQCRLNACQYRLNVRQCRLNTRQCQLHARRDAIYRVSCIGSPVSRLLHRAPFIQPAKATSSTAPKLGFESFAR